MRVAVVTVGDELLVGETVNTNAAWLGQRLHERGVTVERMTTVPDRTADVARVVNEYHADYDAVIVTGGLGPTHDDITIDGVAAAFGAEVTEHPEAIAWLTEHGGYSHEDLAEGTAQLPAGARMVPNHEGVAPGCVIENCYVLPGVPAEMKRMFAEVADAFSGEQRHVVTVDADEPESGLVDRIETARQLFPVKIGSYPGEYVTLRIEGPEVEPVEEAADWLRERVDAP